MKLKENQYHSETLCLNSSVSLTDKGSHCCLFTTIGISVAFADVHVLGWLLGDLCSRRLRAGQRRAAHTRTSGSQTGPRRPDVTRHLHQD